jgi:uncharacterized protein DUF1588/uncharacterized protein DUF1595/uncharacterized protein DUF1592
MGRIESPRAIALSWGVHVRVPLAAALTLLAGCHGIIGDVSGRAPTTVVRDASTTPAPSLDAGPPPCAPEVTAVPKLLRLSNYEYQNMVSDLIGAPVDDALFAHWTPVAEVYGFDTMSETRVDAQALEEELATAESLASILLATPSVSARCPAVLPEETPVCAKKAAYSSRDDFSDAQSRECWTYLDSSGALMIFDNARNLWRKEPDETALLWREGAHPGATVDVIRRWQSPLTGSATVTVSFADADPGGGDGVLVSVLVNDRLIFSQDLANGGSTSFTQWRPFAQGDRLDFIVNRKADPSYDTTAFSASVELTPTPRKVAWTWASCAEAIVSKLGSRAFRRPLRAEELEGYRAMFETTRRDAAAAGFAEPVDEALKGVLQAILMSPNFVFKPELVPNGVDPSERSYAIASRLGLFFRSSLPDDALWALAASGGLLDREAVRAEALRLVGRDLDRFSTHFGGQWLAFRTRSPGPLAENMFRESRDVFAAVLSEGMMPERLLRPGFTLVDPELAAFYSLPTAGGQGRRVSTDQRGGLLSQGAFLSRDVNGSQFVRPIHRGLWVLTRLLCRTLPRLDRATREEINKSISSIDPSLPLPERMRMHRSSAMRCGGCHNNIDPIGLALEKYDARGLWRDAYPDGSAIMSDLQLAGMTVGDPFVLAQAIEALPDFRSCVGTKLLTFALNRGPLDSEQCIAERIGRPLDGPPPSLESMAVEALLKGIELTEVPR